MGSGGPKEDKDLCRGCIRVSVIEMPRYEKMDEVSWNGDVPSIAFLSNNLTPSFSQRIGIRRQSRLHTDFDGFKRTERNVGQEFGAGAGCQEHNSLVGIRKEAVAIPVLEDLIESVFSSALCRVGGKGRRPAEEDTTETFSLIN
jgi:hypothetical protein